jgi:hypothetical protein
VSDKQPLHAGAGSRSHYSNRGCRCDECTAAQSDYNKHWMRRRSAKNREIRELVAQYRKRRDSEGSTL